MMHSFTTESAKQNREWAQTAAEELNDLSAEIVMVIAVSGERVILHCRDRMRSCDREVFLAWLHQAQEALKTIREI